MPFLSGHAKFIMARDQKTDEAVLDSIPGYKVYA